MCFPDPIGILQSRNFSLKKGSRKTLDIASSRGLQWQAYQRFDSEIWHCSGDVQGREDRQRYTVDCPLLVVFEGEKRHVQPLKLQSRTADEKNRRQKRQIWRRSTNNPVQRPTTMGAILFGVARRVHINIHLKLTSMYCFFLGGGGGDQKLGLVERGRKRHKMEQHAYGCGSVVIYLWVCCVYHNITGEPRTCCMVWPALSHLRRPMQCLPCVTWKRIVNSFTQLAHFLLVSFFLQTLLPFIAPHWLKQSFGKWKKKLVRISNFSRFLALLQPKPHFTSNGTLR